MNLEHILMPSLVIFSALVAIIFYYKFDFYRNLTRGDIDWIPLGIILIVFGYGLEVIFNECDMYSFKIEVLRSLLIFSGFISFAVGFLKVKTKKS